MAIDYVPAGHTSPAAPLHAAVHPREPNQTGAGNGGGGRQEAQEALDLDSAPRRETPLRHQFLAENHLAGGTGQPDEKNLKALFDLFDSPSRAIPLRSEADGDHVSAALYIC